MKSPQFCAYNVNSGAVVEHGIGRAATQFALDSWISPANFALRIYDPSEVLDIPGTYAGEGIDQTFTPADGIEFVYSLGDIAEAGGEIVEGNVTRREPIPLPEVMVRDAIANRTPAEARALGVRLMKKLARRHVAKIRRALELNDEDPDFADPDDIAKIQAIKDILRPIIVAASQATTVQEFRAQWDALVSITGDSF